MMFISEVQLVSQAASRGLAGVSVANTQVGGVRGSEGFFHYRQYSAVDLARERTFDDVWHLLHNGSLPSATQEAAFTSAARVARTLEPATEQLLDAIAGHIGASEALLPWVRTALSLVANTSRVAPWLDRGHDDEDVVDEVLRLVASLPTLVARMYRVSQGLAPIEPRDDLGTVANLLWMLEGMEPDDHRVRALEAYLILTVDHGLNASTFTSRVVASTGADVGGAMAAGIAALSGPLHGGAPSLVVDMLLDIGSVDAAPSWAQAKLESGGVIMGFGHRVYRTDDPRSVMLKLVATELGGDFVDLAIGVEQVLLDVLAQHRPGREIRTNVEYFAGVVLHRLGLDPVLYPSLFAISRSVGWGAHILEQIADNKIYRPSSQYTGPIAPEPVPPRDDGAHRVAH